MSLRSLCAALLRLLRQATLKSLGHCRTRATVKQCTIAGTLGQPQLGCRKRHADWELWVRPHSAQDLVAAAGLSCSRIRRMHLFENGRLLITLSFRSGRALAA